MASGTSGDASSGSGAASRGGTDESVSGTIESPHAAIAVSAKIHRGIVPDLARAISISSVVMSI
jgi:hypothetical protein